ncbi:HSF-type DNA-binding-domain-containing protein, partial [Mycena pura]
MASSKQVTLARASRPSSHAPPVTRIPAFLNKLYEMVNDDKTNHLIEWSASGDTFYVYDQERFSRDVLPHWFKHQNFASFVRQLNMYGFHKIPHLKQGVLRSEADSEHWKFVHDDFRRDQPGRLRQIQRKKAGNTVEDDSKFESASAALPAGANGQVLDLQSVVNGIAAIKRHQTAISAELSELKHNNELLWQESEAARARHQKQQDTINRIVKFLAGVFGHPASSPVHKEDVSPSRVAVPRRQARLMIENNPKR